MSNQNFGILIAYLIPGFIATFGVSLRSPLLQNLIGQTQNCESPTIGGFLILTIVAVFAGLTMSTVRWLLVDSMHHWTGIKQPQWEFEILEDRIRAFETLIEIHYRYYQFYGNCFVSIPVFMAFRVSTGSIDWYEFSAAVLLMMFFWLGSRDTLRKYYKRMARLLKSRPTTGQLR